MKKIVAPWTEEQVEGLQRWQERFHPYTCPRHSKDGHATEDLVPSEAGWLCPSCDYTQDWAHAMSVLES